jgi:hypothetical protein
MNGDPGQFRNALELRVRRSYLVTGVVCAIEFFVIGTGSVLLAAVNIDGSFPHPIAMAVFFGVFWGAWFVAGLYTIAVGCLEKLAVTPDAIVQKGVFRTRTTALSEITSVRWRGWPVGGSVVIRYPDSRMTIRFSRFVADERRLLIDRLRELISEERQDNRESFENAELRPRIHPQKSRSSAVVCMLLMFIFAGLFVSCWRMQLGFRFLVVGVVCVLIGLSYLIRILRYVPKSKPEASA